MSKKLTLESKIGELYRSPVGHDALAKVLLQIGLPEKVITNPVVAGMKLKTVAGMTKKKLGTDFYEALLRLVNSEQDEPAPGDGRIAEKWWKEAVFYQIYPRSFYDSNGDGITNNDDPPVNTVDGRKPGVYTLLVAGVDVVSNNTDTIMIGRLDTVNHTLNVVSIPRDTLTNIQHEVKKANSAYHYAAYYSGIQSSSYYGCDPIKKMREELIKSFLGFDVDGYILVNMDAAEQVVDAIGGVDFNVPPGMNYDDPTQDLHIHIPEGQQKLNGEQFVQLMRFRSGYAGGDIQRIDMQHELLMAVASQMISLKNIPNLTEVISIVSDNMETSLTAENMLYYAKEFLKLDSENIKFYTMPGDTGGNVFGASYVFCDIDAWLDMVNECLNPWEAQVTTENVNIVTYKDGNFYSTTGELSGGVSSFLNYSSSSTMGVANVYTYTSSPSTTNSGSKDDNE